MGPPPAADKDGWVVKESATYKGNFYRYNPTSGQSEWIAQEGAPKASPEPLRASQQLKSLSTTKGRGRHPLPRSSRHSVVSWGTEDTDYSECICTICECSKHACPKHSYNPTDFDGNSRYREDYPAHPVRPRDRIALKRVAQATPADPDHFKSKYGEDFQPFAPEPPQSMKPKMAAPTHVPFMGTTTNREMFSPKPVDVRPLKRPVSPVRRTLPFDGTTTNREQFQPHPEVRPRESMAPVVRGIPTAPFDGLTHYRKDYPPHDVTAPKKVMPNANPYAYGPPRNLETEQRSAFTKKPISYCPVLDLDPKDCSMHTGHIHYTKKERPDFKYFPGRVGLDGSPSPTMRASKASV